MSERRKYKILSNQLIGQQVYQLILESPAIVESAKAGQFVNVYLDDKGKLLPRPISICRIDRPAGRLELVYKILGQGTDQLSRYQVGQSLDLMGPLGNGYDWSNLQTKKAKNILLVGGGVGIPPLVQLSRELLVLGHRVTVVLGYQDVPFLEQWFEEVENRVICTDSGRSGVRGNVLVGIQTLPPDYDYVFACGPRPMLAGLKQFCLAQEIDGQFSLEERMGCGFGACVGCVVKYFPSTDEAIYEYKKVCTDGPVFDYKKVSL